MPKKLKNVAPPKGVARWFYRLPIQLYKIGLGGVLGHRFLLLTHTGRRSKLERKVVLEVVRFDKTARQFVVAAGFGPTSDWYRNIQASPQVVVQSGKLRMDMKANFLSAEEAGQEMVDYARRHPIAARELPRIMGYQLEGGEEDLRAFGETLKMVRFTSDQI